VRTARRRPWPAGLAWAVAGLTVLALVPCLWLARRVWDAGLQPRPPNVAVGAVVLVTASTAVVGAVLAGRRPRHPVGWLLLGIGLTLVATLMLQSYTLYGLLVRPGAPGART
jgi:hypothetical protein